MIWARFSLEGMDAFSRESGRKEGGISNVSDNTDRDYYIERSYGGDHQRLG